MFHTRISSGSSKSLFRIPSEKDSTTLALLSFQLQKHMENECPKQEVSCPFGDCGCEFRGQRTEITQHMKDSPGLHLNIAARTIAIQKKLMEAYDERMAEQKKWIESLARRVNALDKTYGAQYIWKLDHYQVPSIVASTFLQMLVGIDIGTAG